MDWTWYLFSFKGRINCAKLWLALAISVCWVFGQAFLVVVLDAILTGSTELSHSGLAYMFELLGSGAHSPLSTDRLPAIVLDAIMTLVSWWAFLATSIKRLHDRNKNGWWLLPYVVAPLLYLYTFRWSLSWTISPISSGTMSFAFVSLVSLLLYILALVGWIDMYFFSGTDGPNRFGPDPLRTIPSRRTGEIQTEPGGASLPAWLRVKREHD